MALLMYNVIYRAPNQRDQAQEGKPKDMQRPEIEKSTRAYGLGSFRLVALRMVYSRQLLSLLCPLTFDSYSDLSSMVSKGAERALSARKEHRSTV